MTSRVGRGEWDSTTIRVHLVICNLEKISYYIVLQNILVLKLTAYTIWGQWDVKQI